MSLTTFEHLSEQDLQKQTELPMLQAKRKKEKLKRSSREREREINDVCRVRHYALRARIIGATLHSFCIVHRASTTEQAIRYLHIYVSRCVFYSSRREK